MSHADAPTVPLDRPLPPVETSERTRAALGVAAGAVALGVIGDGLLRVQPWGLNLGLWTLELAGVALLLRRWTEAERRSVAWVPWALAAAALLAWRDSATLRALDALAIALVVGFGVAHAHGWPLLRTGVVRWLTGTGEAWVRGVLGAVPLLTTDVRWAEMPGGTWRRSAQAVGRGLLLAAPLLFLFGTLLASADAVFAHGLARLFDRDVASLASHAALTAGVAWVAGGLLRTLFLDEGMRPVVPADEKLPRLGTTEAVTVLALLDLLFAGFVAVQLRWLFGGADVVLGSETVTYADYARRGFFELVAVATLCLPLLLVLDWGVRDESPHGRRIVHLLSAGLVALLAVVAASALRRMALYVDAYGWTELRLFTSAFMVWLAIVLAWFGATVLRGRRDRFLLGALGSGAAMLVALHAANPDAWIVRGNLDRLAGTSVGAEAAAAVHPSTSTSSSPSSSASSASSSSSMPADVPTTRFDAWYATSLGADAVPVLVARLVELPAADRCLVAARLLERWDPAADRDWRAWSWGRGRAVAAVHANEAALRDAACAERLRGGTGTAYAAVR